MSLNQLPDELIAHIGSFLNFDDNLQFGFSQKRIYNILKRDGHDKPICEDMMIGFLEEEFDCSFSLPDGKGHFLFDEVFGEDINIDFHSRVGEFLSKFRKVDTIVFLHGWTANGDVFSDIMNTKAELGYLEIGSEIDDVDPNIFIAACKKIKWIQIEDSRMPSELCVDKKYIETDSFDIEHDLGILKFQEERSARLWMDEINANPDSQYRINRSFHENIDGDTWEFIEYSIKLESCTREHRTCIEFYIDKEEV